MRLPRRVQEGVSAHSGGCTGKHARATLPTPPNPPRFTQDWATARPAIMRHNMWEKCSSEVMIRCATHANPNPTRTQLTRECRARSTPRRFGKTFACGTPLEPERLKAPAERAHFAAASRSSAPASPSRSASRSSSSVSSARLTLIRPLVRIGRLSLLSSFGCRALGPVARFTFWRPRGLACCRVPCKLAGPARRASRKLLERMVE